MNQGALGVLAFLGIVAILVACVVLIVASDPEIPQPQKLKRLGYILLSIGSLHALPGLGYLWLRAIGG